MKYLREREREMERGKEKQGEKERRREIERLMLSHAREIERRKYVNRDIGRGRGKKGDKIIL